MAQKRTATINKFLLKMGGYSNNRHVSCPGGTWIIIAVSKWSITIVIVSPLKDRVAILPKGHENG